MKRVVKIHHGSTLLAGVVALVALFVFGWDAASQIQPARATLVRAEPPLNALLADAPDRIVLTFSEAIDEERASIRLLGAGGIEVALGPVIVDADNPSQVISRPTSILGSDDYMVIWSARTASDSALLAGAYPFRTGVITNPGAARFDWQWPTPWAALLRALVFLGTALAAGGFGWSRLLASGSRARQPVSLLRAGVMAGGALVALLATLVPPLVQPLILSSSKQAVTLTASLRAMPLGWWMQLVALAALVMLCLGTLSTTRTSPAAAAPLDWVGLAIGLAALTGLSFTSHAAASRNGFALALEIAHQWSAAIWISGLLYLAVGWRALGTDISRFRTVRWVGGALFGVSVITGFAVAMISEPSFANALSTRYGQVLAGKSLFVVVILALGLLALIVPRRTSARRAGGSLAAQGVLGLIVTLFAAVLALMAAPGLVAPAVLAGIELVDVVPLDARAFGAGSGMIHLLVQPASSGPETIVVQITDSNGDSLAPDPSPEIDVVWTRLTFPESIEVTTRLQSDPSGAVFSGATELVTSGWWRADVVITPPGGIASRARFWLVLPDPTTSGRGLELENDPAARELFARGLDSLISLRAVRFSQRLNDGAGSLERSRAAVSTEGDGIPAMFTDSTIDAAGDMIAQERIIGDRRWVQVREEGWSEAEPTPILTLAAWGDTYDGATGFQLGPREEVDGELCQVITFWQPPGQDRSRAATWFAWWIGLASGEVRREALVSPRQYLDRSYNDFNAPLEITAPVTTSQPMPAATPKLNDATPIATPFA